MCIQVGNIGYNDDFTNVINLLFPGEYFETNGAEFAYTETLEPVNPPSEVIFWR